MALWLISLRGFDDHIVEAPTRGAARYKDFLSARDMGYFAFFDHYLDRCRIRRAPPTSSQDQGEKK